MKRTSCIFCAISAAFTLAAMAAIPPQISYQGYLTRPNGTPLDTVVAMTFRLYSGSSGGSALWMETQPSCTVRAGLFNVLLGSVVAVPDSFQGTGRWLGITVGGNSEMLPRQRSVSVPYAYRVGTVDGASGGTIAGDVIIGGKANIGASNTNAGSHAFVAGSGSIASGNYSTISGGRNNTVRGLYSVVAGGGGSSVLDSNSASGSYSAIGGGRRNIAANDHATVGGGFNNSASAASATVGGGYQNTAVIAGAVVSGGYYNDAAGTSATIGGGYDNYAGGYTATVGGGRYNYARGDYSVIAGGGGVGLSDSNSAAGESSAIGGGRHNVATSSYAVVGGGVGNNAGSNSAVVGGGYYNQASGPQSAVGGGYSNSATFVCATVSGGNSNIAAANSATVGGGEANYAAGSYSTIPGGKNNRATGDYSFAAGRRAQTNGDGVFAWADATGDTFGIGLINSFNARASNGFRFWTTSDITQNIGARLPGGSSTWTTLSDSTKKRNIRPVDTEQMLERVKRLPIRQWSYITQDPSIEHIGPLAQDFWNLFHIGDDSLTISTIDPGGIALAAIQELAKQVIELRARVQTLEANQQEAINRK